MKTIILSPSDQQNHLATHKFILTFADIVALGAGTSGVIQLMPATGVGIIDTKVRFAELKLVTPFVSTSDATINSLLIEIGDGNSTARLLTQTELAEAGTEIVAKGSALNYTYPIADSIDAVFTVAGGASPTLAEITSGEVHIYLWIRTQRNITRVVGSLSA
jgi:hypothetical protein